jgi:hypothetical protein
MTEHFKQWLKHANLSEDDPLIKIYLGKEKIIIKDGKYVRVPVNPDDKNLKELASKYITGEQFDAL